MNAVMATILAYNKSIVVQELIRCDTEWVSVIIFGITEKLMFLS